MYIGYATDNYDDLSRGVLTTADWHAERFSNKNLYAALDVARYCFIAGRTIEAFRMLGRFLDYVR